MTTVVLTGFNTDIEHSGTTYHVQTEDTPAVKFSTHVGPRTTTWSNRRWTAKRSRRSWSDNIDRSSMPSRPAAWLD
jgi:hypothetical protein